MTEITVESTDNPEETDLVEEDEHAAAREAGAAEVHKEGAEEAAEEAAAAAETALAVAGDTIASTNVAEEAARSAAESANAANSGAHAVAEAITAQTAVLQSLLSQLESPKQESTTPTDGPPPKKESDRAPGKKRRTGLGSKYYGG